MCPKMEVTNVFLCRESSQSASVSPVVMNYKMRHNKNRPARNSLVWLDHFSVISICGGRKTEKHGLDMRGYVQGSHGGRLAQCMSYPEHWSIAVDR